MTSDRKFVVIKGGRYLEADKATLTEDRSQAGMFSFEEVALIFPEDPDTDTDMEFEAA
jgi:hypothetical protein